MLASTTLHRGDSLWPSTVERSRRELARRDCLAWGVISDGKEVGRSLQGGKGSRPLGIGVSSAKGFRARRGVVSGGTRSGGRWSMYWALRPLLCGHPFSFFCFSIRSASSAPASTLLFPPTRSRSLSHADRGSFWRWGATRFWAAVRSLSRATFGVVSAVPGFPNPFRLLAMSFRRLDMHLSCALVTEIESVYQPQSDLCLSLQPSCISVEVGWDLSFQLHDKQ